MNTSSGDVLPSTPSHLSNLKETIHPFFFLGNIDKLHEGQGHQSTSCESLHVKKATNQLKTLKRVYSDLSSVS